MPQWGVTTTASFAFAKSPIVFRMKSRSRPQLRTCFFESGIPFVAPATVSEANEQAK